MFLLVQWQPLLYWKKSTYLLQAVLWVFPSFFTCSTWALQHLETIPRKIVEAHLTPPCCFNPKDLNNLSPPFAPGLQNRKSTSGRQALQCTTLSPFVTWRLWYSLQLHLTFAPVLFSVCFPPSFSGAESSDLILQVRRDERNWETWVACNFFHIKEHTNPRLSATANSFKSEKRQFESNLANCSENLPAPVLTALGYTHQRTENKNFSAIIWRWKSRHTSQKVIQFTILN